MRGKEDQKCQATDAVSGGQGHKALFWEDSRRRTVNIRRKSYLLILDRSCREGMTGRRRTEEKRERTNSP